MERILTIIPAKSRSSRLPGKNIALLRGKPLLIYAIEQAQEAGVCGEICVGTDDQTIAKMAEAAGAVVPFLRHDDVDDITPVGVAALNILRRYEKELKRKFDLICLLLTTSPLRAPEDIVNCYNLLKTNENFDAVISLTKSEKSPFWSWCFVNQTTVQPIFPDKCHLDKDRLPSAYYVNGAVYWARADFFARVNGNQYAGHVGGYVMPPDRGLDIDTPLDLAFAEFLLTQKAY